MRIIVFSDSHRDFNLLFSTAAKHKDDADMFFHLGDGLRQFETVMQHFPEKDFLCVKGNCDIGSFERNIAFYGAGDYKILLTHGHTCHVKYGLDPFVSLARENNAHIALYGHTHENFTTYIDNLYIMNPGSLSQPRNGSRASYGIIDITSAGIVLNIVEL